jgi:NADH dehydrogenase [ubiquinone] 1 alpha subcomplex assembly factor 7
MGPDGLGPPGTSAGADGGSEFAVDPVLRRRLRAAADPEGFLSFDRFMEIALYDPGRGFYDRAETRLGRGGDFYTAAHVHRLFGATLAAYFEKVRSAAGAPARFPIVEVGPGDGTLAGDIRTALVQAPSGSRGWEYVLVERSVALRVAVEQRLGPPNVGPVPWRFAPSLAAEGPFRGILLANELLDAFPFLRLEKTPDGWAELGVHVAEQGPLKSEVRAARRTEPVEGLPESAPSGTVLEVSPSMEAWIRELADHFVGGRVILIDYGEEEEALVRKGSAGTLEAIRDHRPVDPLSRPGTADLSAWVNFTRVRRVARAAGFREESYGSLAEAMVRWGVDEVRTRWQETLDPVEAVKVQLAQKSFLFGFGTFRVLELTPAGGSG